MSSESRILGVILSCLLHAVIGAALMWQWRQPMGGVTPSASQTAIVVELLPAMTATFIDDPSLSAPRTPVPQDRDPRRLSLPNSPRSPPRKGSRVTSSGPAPVVALQPANTDAMASPSADEAVPFRAALLAHIERFRHYPEEAWRRSEQGVALVGFAMDRRGSLIDLWLDRSSGFPRLDTEALDTIRRAQPLPPLPESLPEPLQVTVPVSFALL